MFGCCCRFVCVKLLGVFGWFGMLVVCVYKLCWEFECVFVCGCFKFLMLVFGGFSFVLGFRF